MKTINQVLKEKGSEIWATAPNKMVIDALQVMADKDIGALLVMDGEKLVGIFSERDYARKVILKGKSSKELAVREVMSSHIYYITPDITCEQALDLMTQKRVRHLPVLDGNKLIGVVSIGDLVKAVIAYQKQVINRLEKHILETTSIT
ncbi:MAG: CBS domain-containing protein [Chloroflexota bacterium]